MTTAKCEWKYRSKEASQNMSVTRGQQSPILRFDPYSWPLHPLTLNNGGKGGANTVCHRGGRFMSDDCSLLNILICRHLQFINPTSYSVMPGVIMCCDRVSSRVCSSSSSLTDRPLNENREARRRGQRLKRALITVRRPSAWAASLISLACVYCQYGI